MSVEQFMIDTKAVLSAKYERLQARQAKTPSAAVIALADMQILPRPVLNVVTGGESITLIGQIAYSEVYDPVHAALKYTRAGVDAVAFFTDEEIYPNGLEDLLLVSRGTKRPVICQDFILNEYHVAEARAAGASALVLYASLLEPDVLRRTVSITQRWRMAALVQVEDGEQLAQVRALSPHVVCIGRPLATDIDEDLETLAQLRAEIPHNVRVMLLGCLPTLEHVEVALELGVDAVTVNESILGHPIKSQNLRDMLARFSS